MFELGTDLDVPAKGVGRHVWVFFPLVEDAVRLQGSVPLDLVIVSCLLALDEPAIAGRHRI